MSSVLCVRGLGKEYGTRTAVASIDLDVNAGECFGLLGPNGAGKTTTISMASGVIAPTRGTIAICGIDLASHPREAKRKLGLVPQELALYDELSAIQNLRYFGALYGLSGALLAERSDWVLEVAGLRERAREPVKRYSGGMKRRLNIAIGLLHRPQVLILDEPTVGVDPQSRTHIFETIRALHAGGTAVVYTSHYMEEVEALCDRVAIIDRGAIVATGSVKELVATHASRAVEIELGGEPIAIEAAMRAAANHGTIEASHGSVLRVVPAAGLAPVIVAIEGAGVSIERIMLGQASLETAFLSLTGRALRDAS